jgi:hypothetical protein
MEAIIFFETSVDLYRSTRATAVRNSDQTKFYTHVYKYFFLGGGVLPHEIPVASSSQNILATFSVTSYTPAFFLEWFT